MQKVANAQRGPAVRLGLLPVLLRSSKKPLEQSRIRHIDRAQDRHSSRGRCSIRNQPTLAIRSSIELLARLEFSDGQGLQVKGCACLVGWVVAMFLTQTRILQALLWSEAFPVGFDAPEA